MGKHYLKGNRPGTKPSGHSLAKTVTSPLLYHLKDWFFADKSFRVSSETSLPTIQGVGLPFRTRDNFRFVSSLKGLPFNFARWRSMPVPQFEFSFEVIQLRLATLLSVLISLMWLTSGLFSGFGMNAYATSLLILQVFEWFLSLYKLTLRYPLGESIGFSKFHLFQRQCRTLPKVDTWYFGKPSMSFQYSFSI